LRAKSDPHLLIPLELLHRLLDMARATKNPPTPTDGRLGCATTEIAAKDQWIKIQLIEIIRTLREQPLGRIIVKPLRRRRCHLPKQARNEKNCSLRPFFN
jgi:hypothetical protein